MRMLLKAVLDTETVNERINERLRGGVQGRPFERLRELLRPEAFYLFNEDGQRALFAVFDLADQSQIPAIIEPLFLQGKAKVTVTPCLTVEDADKAMETGPPDGCYAGLVSLPKFRNLTASVMAPRSVRAITAVCPL
jgi:hypothetical protein